MTRKFLGTPCWYELATSRGDLAAAGEFYVHIVRALGARPAV
jgi:hypothetical protein